MFAHMLPHAKAKAKADKAPLATVPGAEKRKAAPTPRRPSDAPMPLGQPGAGAPPGAKAGGWAAPLLSKDGEEYYAVDEEEEGCWDRTCGRCFAWAMAPDVLGHVSAQKVSLNGGKWVRL